MCIIAPPFRLSWVHAACHNPSADGLKTGGLSGALAAVSGFILSTWGILSTVEKFLPALRRDSPRHGGLLCLSAPVLHCRNREVPDACGTASYKTPLGSFGFAARK